MPLPPVRQLVMQGLLVWLALWLGAMPAAAAQGVELSTLRAARADGFIELEFAARITLPRAVEEALQRGVPVYFVAEAELMRNRWYWRDERIARVSRTWRLGFQPLTGNWRLSLGGLSQSYATLAEALAVASRSAGWRLVEASQVDADKSYYVEFSYRLDTSQLPGPMQFGLGGQGEWSIGVARAFKLDLQP